VKRFDVNVIACMPVDLTAMRESLSEEGRARLDEYTPYPNSEKAVCDGCKCEVWVGPRVGLVKQLDANTCVLCMICAVALTKLSELTGEPHQLIDMGGTD
jgi:hypothetical protein